MPPYTKQYAEQAKSEIIQFFSEQTDLPTGKYGAEVYFNPKQFVETAINHLNSDYKSKVFISAMIRLRRYRDIILSNQKKRQ